MASDKENKPFFRDINADDDDPEVMEIESFCVSCESQGMTRIFLTKIPFFKEVIVSSFSCDDCGYRNTELQPGGKIQEKGVKYQVNIKTSKDLDRQVIQTNTCTVSIPKLDFEIPPNKGVLTTVEGVLDKATEGLQQDQPVRKIQHPEIAAQIDQFIEKLNDLRKVTEPFQIVVDDPSGNSFVENPHAPNTDPDTTIHYYVRSKAQDESLGIMENEDSEDVPKTEEVKKPEEDNFTGLDEVMTFQTNCPNCNTPCVTNMKMVDIPHFKHVLIMAINCDACGYRDNEVKGGAGVEPKGTKITLHLTDLTDMSRDVLKSETCAMSIPELDFELQMGTLGGKFTTLEGLITSIKDELSKKNPFLFGDSSTGSTKDKLNEFCKELDKIINGEKLGIHIILDDPAGNSYVQNVYAPDSDPEMKIEHYERSFDHNEELGLNDMKTENYESS